MEIIERFVHYCLNQADDGISTKRMASNADRGSDDDLTNGTSTRRLYVLASSSLLTADYCLEMIYPQTAGLGSTPSLHHIRGIYDTADNHLRNGVPAVYHVCGFWKVAPQ